MQGLGVILNGSWSLSGFGSLPSLPSAGLQPWRRPLKTLEIIKNTCSFLALNAVFSGVFRVSFREAFLVFFELFLTVFHEKPSISWRILQSTQFMNLLLFRLAPGSCDFASCFAMFSKGELSGFRGAKSCFYICF